METDNADLQGQLELLKPYAIIIRNRWNELHEGHIPDMPLERVHDIEQQLYMEFCSGVEQLIAREKALGQDLEDDENPIWEHFSLVGAGGCEVWFGWSWC